MYGRERAAHRTGGHQTSGAVVEPWLYDPGTGPKAEAQRKPSSRRGSNPYLALAALLAALALSWLPVALLLIWLL
ncbi:MAG: hypothetical protein ACJ75R_06735 [Solirubrobacterales bacterium]